MFFFKIVKNRLSKLPFFLGFLISTVPFNFRPGFFVLYNKRIRELDCFDEMNLDNKKEFIFRRFKIIVDYAYENIDFYRSFYDRNGFHPSFLKGYDDIEKVPIVSKSDFQSFSMSGRVNSSLKASKENTGGSSGVPLEMLIQPDSIPHEWAHMHQVWSKVNFKYTDLRIVFSGRSDVKGFVQYDSARHQINVDVYASWENVSDKLLLVFNKFNPTYIHGYPSAIFDFVIWLNDNDHPLFIVLKKNIKGLLLGSEFPNPILRDKVENLLNCASVSWYGHTERSVLAYEKYKKYDYVPFHSYGFTEAVPGDDGFQLVSTSYYNFAHPFIRYNTEDLVDPNFDGLLKSFEISKGRDGEFIFDFNGRKVYLTALLFGRHHEIFDFCSSIQFYQKEKGFVTVLFVKRFDFDFDVKDLFDMSNVDVNFSFLSIDSPKKTNNGKKPLLVKEI